MFRFDPKQRNRMPVSLPILQIEVAGIMGQHLITDPNGLALAGFRREFCGWLGSDRLISDASGRAGCLVYLAGDVRLQLTPREMDRFARHALMPKEYGALVCKFGMFYEVHEDFYDPDTGEPLQPIE